MIVLPLLVHACALGEFVLEPTYEDFKTKYMRILIFIFMSNEASVLDHVEPMTLISLLYIHLHAINLNMMLFTFPYHSLST
jgi:hypothetical protein